MAAILNRRFYSLKTLKMNYLYKVYTNGFYFGTFKNLENAKQTVTNCRRGLSAWQFESKHDGSIVGTSPYTNEKITILKV